MELNKTFVDKVVSPEKGQEFYRDDELKGFALRVTSSGAKSFILEKRVNGKVKRITLGRYPGLTVEQARKEAQKLSGKIATGIDPIAAKKESLSKVITLRQVFQDYALARKNNLKANTLRDYERVLNQVVKDWLDKPLLSITKDKVAKRHAEYGEQKSQAGANLVMRVLRALFNFAAGQYEDAKGQSLILENPVKRLSHTRAWYRVDRRQSMIKSHELKAWYVGLQQLYHRHSSVKVEMTQDYLMLVLLTGLRREEALSLSWHEIDFKVKTLTIIETKNHNKHTLPLSDYLYDLLKRRYNSRVNQYVFPSDSQTGYLNDPRKAMLKVRELSGVEFTVHDLRRTFITIAESLDIPVYALKRLLNHKMKSDVTAGYVVIDIERLRKPMQMIADHILKLIGLKPLADVVNIKQA